MFEYTALFISLIVVAFISNFTICYFSGGVRQNLLHIFINCTFIIYLFFTPVIYFFSGYYYAFQMNVKEYFGIGFLQILLHIIFYTFGYLLFIKIQKNKKNKYLFCTEDFRKKVGKEIENKIFVFFSVSYIAVFLNTLSVGINLLDVFLGKFGDPTMGLRGGSYYIQNLADSLIGFIVIAYFFKIKRSYFLIILLCSIPLFLILGFRYRIILSFFGIVLIYLFDYQISVKSVFKYFLIFFIAFYVLLLLTHNRYAIYMQKYDSVTFDISDFDFDIVTSQSRGSMIDFAVYKHIDSGKGKIDYGETMFGYVFIKMFPSFVFSGGVKPYPPPQLPLIDDAINGTRDNGEAVTSLGGTFVAFYYPGIYFFAFILGIIISKLQNQFNKSYLGMISSILITLAIFQWITRGYFPQEIDHLVYMIFPIILLKIFVSKKKIFSQI